eukprot:scaffold298040_cov30-Tisochrysis_lutea.AAC.4
MNRLTPTHKNHVHAQIRNEGVIAAPKPVALGQGLIMTLTSTPMPKLMVTAPEYNWSKIWLRRTPEEGAALDGIFARHGAPVQRGCFRAAVPQQPWLVGIRYFAARNLRLDLIVAIRHGGRVLLLSEWFATGPRQNDRQRVIVGRRPPLVFACCAGDDCCA